MFRSVYLLLVLLGTLSFSQAQDFQSYDQLIPGSTESIEMIAIPGGAFLMGSDSREVGRNEDEGPQVHVSVSDFWMASAEITWDQFELFLYREIDDEMLPEGNEVNIQVDGVSAATMPYVNFNRPGYPIVNITQYAASTFCKWLSALTGVYYRLPTEAEWEYACRANTTSSYSFGNAVEEVGFYSWHQGNSNGTFQKGGLKEPNAFGLYDMHGNVAEWVIDNYQPTTYAQIKDGMSNPIIYDPEVLYPNVVRGGSWMDKPERLRSAARLASTKNWKQRDPQFPKSLWWMTDATHVGFRIVRPKSLPSVEEMERLWGKPINEY